MPRKSKPAQKKSANAKASPPAEPSTTASKKRKIDWTSIDDPQPFEGFALKIIKAKAAKPSGPVHKKVKTDSPADETALDNYKDAPTDAEIVQKNPFLGSGLSETRYMIEPKAEWESTKRFRKFTISEAEFEVGQTIFVNKPEDEAGPNDAIKYWVARVLEVRAGDAAHVYLRVYWMYRPEDLPGGRQAHHGDSELIASNDMAIIDALTVVDAANVITWDEDPDKSDWPLKEQMFWRQTLDIEKPKAQQLSKLRSFCVDKAPCNPDEPLVNCPSCEGWLHAHCLEERAAADASEHYKTPIKAKGRPAKNKKKGGRSPSSSAPFSAYLTTKDSGELCLTVTDQRPGESNRKWNVDVHCLLCKTLIEKAAKDVPSEVEPSTSITTTTAPQLNPEDALPLRTNAATTGEAPSSSNASKRGRGRPPKRRSTASSAAEMTPEPAPVSESVLQSGIRSVKRLLWRAG